MSRFLWLPTVADPGKPTAEELAAGVELNTTTEIREVVALEDDPDYYDDDLYIGSVSYED